MTARFLESKLTTPNCFEKCLCFAQSFQELLGSANILWFQQNSKKGRVVRYHRNTLIIV